MKQFIILLVVFFNCSYLPAQWKPAGERIKTEWATKIDVENVLPEYPRPIMERPNWVNLNGLWNYAEILKKGKYVLIQYYFSIFLVKHQKK